MSKDRPTFTEMMARFGFDPDRRHPAIVAPPAPVYLGKGEWGAPDDDRGHGTEDEEFLADLLKDDPPVAPLVGPWYDGDN